MAATIGLALAVSVLTTIYSQDAFALSIIRPNPTPGSPAGGPCVSGSVCGGNAGNGGIAGNGGTCTTSSCIQNGEAALGGSGGTAQDQNGGNGGVGANGGNGASG